MKTFAQILFVVFCFRAAAQTSDPGIRFVADATPFASILDQSKRENKLIFVDAYTSWCGPCKWMDKNVFTAPEVGQYFNSNFINAKFNMEEGEGIDLRKQYQVMTYPTFLFLNGDGEVVHRMCGSSPKDVFLTQSKVALDNEKNLKSFVTKYENGNRDVSFLRQYLDLGVSMCLEMHSVANEYWKTLDKKDWITKDNWGLFTTYVRDFESEQFQHQINNYDDARTDEKQAAEVDAYAEKILYQALLQPMVKKEDQLLASNRQKIARMNVAPAQKALILTNIVQHEKAKDWKSYAAEADKYIQKFRFDKPERINDFAWTIYQNVSDPELLTRAGGWMKEMVNEEKNKKYLYLETYASLLRKSGRIDEANKISADAVALAENSGENYRVEREIREAKTSLRNDLEQIRRDLEQAVADGDTEKAAKLERARQDRISAHNEKITKLLAAAEKKE